MEHLERWMQGLQVTLDMTLKYPDTPAEGWVLSMAALLACAIILRITASACGLGRPTFVRSFIVSAVGLALILLGMTAINLVHAAAGVWVLTATVIGISLILIIPMLSFLLKGNYIVAFFAWLISMGAVAAVIVLLSAGFNVVTAGIQDAGKARQHKHDQEQILGSQ